MCVFVGYWFRVSVEEESKKAKNIGSGGKRNAAAHKSKIIYCSFGMLEMKNKTKCILVFV